jgi:hypothetical protein
MLKRRLPDAVTQSTITVLLQNILCKPTSTSSMEKVEDLIARSALTWLRVLNDADIAARSFDCCHKKYLSTSKRWEVDVRWLD